MNSRSTRVLHYREQAARLRAMAAKERQGSTIQGELLKLAAEYDRLAAEVESARF
jgi:hypothetical protein